MAHAFLRNSKPSTTTKFDYNPASSLSGIASCAVSLTVRRPVILRGYWHSRILWLIYWDPQRRRRRRCLGLSLRRNLWRNWGRRESATTAHRRPFMWHPYITPASTTRKWSSRPCCIEDRGHHALITTCMQPITTNHLEVDLHSPFIPWKGREKDLCVIIIPWRGLTFRSSRYEQLKNTPRCKLSKLFHPDQDSIESDCEEQCGMMIACAWYSFAFLASKQQSNWI